MHFYALFFVSFPPHCLLFITDSQAEHTLTHLAISSSSLSSFHYHFSNRQHRQQPTEKQTKTSRPPKASALSTGAPCSLDQDRVAHLVLPRVSSPYNVSSSVGRSSGPRIHPKPRSNPLSTSLLSFTLLNRPSPSRNFFSRDPH